MPQLADLARRMSEILLQENITIEITQGLRTVAEQNALYAEGRTSPGRIVTNAKGTESWHVLGCAVDVAPFDNGIPDWNSRHPAWNRIVEVGESLGLASGISYKDEPHFELTGKYPPDPPQEVKDLYASGGLPAVWEAVQS
jgi:peptidoglycan LD-endopeptidase CwlK